MRDFSKNDNTFVSARIACNIISTQPLTPRYGVEEHRATQPPSRLPCSCIQTPTKECCVELNRFYEALHLFYCLAQRYSRVRAATTIRMRTPTHDCTITTHAHMSGHRWILMKIVSTPITHLLVSAARSILACHNTSVTHFIVASSPSLHSHTASTSSASVRAGSEHRTKPHTLHFHRKSFVRDGSGTLGAFVESKWEYSCRS